MRMTWLVEPAGEGTSRLTVTSEGMGPRTADDFIGLNESGDWLGLQVGAGAIGLISERAGVRFDLRHFRALSRDTTLRGERASKLSFWRASVGFTLRY